MTALELIGAYWNLLPSLPRTLIAFAIVLGVLVFIHELGHYLAARWRGVHVDAFSIGFGQPIWRRTDRHGTEWRLSWIPLGGYVKLHGQETPEDATPEQRAAWMPGRTFHEKSVGSRAIIVAAGPVANFLLAILLFAGLFATIGKPVSDPREQTVIGRVTPDSPAERAGLHAGDRILALDGEAVVRFEDIQHHIQPRAGQEVELRLSRDGAETVVRAVPELGPAGHGILGIQGGATRFERLGLGSALVAGAEQTASVTWQSLVGLGEIITGQRSAKELGGPIRIAEISGEAASLGLTPLVNLMALLSVSLGLLNLFPIPMLDGGHLAFYAAEAIRGRPLPPKAQEYGFRAGFALIVTLFLFASWNDIVHGAIGKWVAALVG
ncbi:RIP metalloprotease RseP [Siccirubricoccus sp. KC 17139]|uniref:Zinc metalloprotease n=1 Tax=Siccirubricoccus soli TaxID=2899147 RepID=A0ABT1DAW9_9PROT|nr:RIP metalloprotease RseP [Siccirubricoccus soli]MCO6419071.1 RIP metalloprotease RseP [Siccirubricoccus soli]MCP2685206.1 RIP metalloprotease RseP [Siccirubricoccus soli]